MEKAVKPEVVETSELYKVYDSSTKREALVNLHVSPRRGFMGLSVSAGGGSYLSIASRGELSKLMEVLEHVLETTTD